jgi:DNA-binding NarL/FixJ family response regulator
MVNPTTMKTGQVSMRILLVDDHAVVRSGMKQMLADNLGDVEIGEAADAGEAIEAVRNADWDIVFLDIRLPGRSGVEVLHHVKATNPGLPVLILSTYPESQYAVRLIRAGAAGYLNKDAEEEEICRAVKLALAGRKYISAEVGELLAGQFGKNADADTPPHELLSNREYQVFLELAFGSRPVDIAEKYKISAKTVATHRSRILEKMGLSNNAELTLYAYRHNLS